ncbi:uncharacterized protein DMAD_08047 [Drosophila madeirensis]|uniref:Secreted protein n=1 Tax=Drosophila madeirensis TaxID=30013 RepID=A0AAU9EQU6_DROMD
MKLNKILKCLLFIILYCNDHWPPPILPPIIHRYATKLSHQLVSHRHQNRHKIQIYNEIQHKIQLKINSKPANCKHLQTLPRPYATAINSTATSAPRGEALCPKQQSRPANHSESRQKLQGRKPKFKHPETHRKPKSQTQGKLGANAEGAIAVSPMMMTSRAGTPRRGSSI